MKNKLLIFFIIAISSNVTAQEISIDSLRAHVEYLASPNLEGRKAGSAGDSLAAYFISQKFSSAGMSMSSKNGFQYFSLVTDIKPGSGNYLELNNSPKNINEDYNPFSFSSNASFKAPVVFAGFGITGQSDSLLWDDYKNLDVKNKWVLILRGDPEPDNPMSGFIPLASDRAKALTAKDKGAGGVLLVSPSSIEKQDKPIEILYDKTVSDAGLPVISITRKLAGLILNKSTSAIDSLEKLMISEKISRSFETESIVYASTEIVRQKTVSRNIIAIVEGVDPVLKNEYVVVGAHYDHLGFGGEGSGSRIPDTIAVHYGADDNASGVSSLIELARHFSNEKNKTSRSLIFIAFGAEEMGIIGSRHFIEHPLVPLTSIKSMINLDMVGRLKIDEDPSINISGTGTSNITDSLLNRLKIGRSFELKTIPDGYGPSDHAAFYTAGIPVSFITTGAHSEYHTPYDSFETLNYKGLRDVTYFTADLISELANVVPAPIFSEAGPRREAGHYGRNLKVTLGIMPDVSGAETSGGMKVEGTRKDAPAARAGMLKGDIITAINGLKVSNIYDYMSRLSKLKPGEVVNVEILRNNKQEVLIIQL